MITSVDQLNRSITLPEFPRRIVSVVPSQTELLYTLGLNEEVVGITKFCVHPEEWFRSKERVGGTKKLNIERIKILSPDLIIANKEENTKEDIDALSKHFPVWVSDIKNIDDAYDMISKMGSIVNRNSQAEKLLSTIRQRFKILAERNFKKSTAIYLIWKNPYMAAGNDTFISNLMAHAGFENLITGERYPELTIESIKSLRPEIVLLSSEPFPFKDKDVHELENQLDGIRVVKVDGEMFSWYGSRLLQSPAYFIALREVLSK